MNGRHFGLLAAVGAMFGSIGPVRGTRRHSMQRTRLAAKSRAHANRRRKLALASKRRNRARA